MGLVLTRSKYTVDSAKMMLIFLQWHIHAVQFWDCDEDGNDFDAESWCVRKLCEYSSELSL